MSKKALRTLNQRDGRRCGIHLGGCGKKISHRDQMSVDHIIPKKIPLSLYDEYPGSFEGHWNLQVMHAECNSRKGSDVSRLLDLKCKCHYYEIRDEDLYMVYIGDRGTESHLIVPGVVDRERSFHHESFGGIDLQSGGGYYKWHTRESRPGETGLYLPVIGSQSVQRFNIHQRKRVGLDAPDAIYVDHVSGEVGPMGDWANRYPWQ